MNGQFSLLPTLCGLFLYFFCVAGFFIKKRSFASFNRVYQKYANAMIYEEK